MKLVTNLLLEVLDICRLFTGVVLSKCTRVQVFSHNVYVIRDIHNPNAFRILSPIMDCHKCPIMKPVSRVVIATCRQHFVPSPARREEVDAYLSTPTMLKAHGQRYVLQFCYVVLRVCTRDGIYGNR